MGAVAWAIRDRLELEREQARLDDLLREALRAQLHADAEPTPLIIETTWEEIKP